MTQAGYEAPNYFQVPIAWYALLADIENASELKVTLAIFRRTFGWHKRGDRISISQLHDETGLTRKAVVAGTEAALERGTITRTRDGQSWEYHVDIYYDLPDDGALPPSAPEGPPAGAPEPPITEQVVKLHEHWLWLCDTNDRHPRSREITPSRRRLYEKGLKEASLDECKAALTGLFLDDWYRDNDHWDIRMVFQTKPGGPNLRAQIDKFIDKAEQHGRGLTVASADPDIVSRAKAAIQRAHDLPDNETAQDRAKAAEEYLNKHGVIVDRSGERPTFRSAT